MNSTHTRKPAITLCRSDHERLTSLADASVGRYPAIAEFLLDELDRARIVEDDELESEFARLGSTLHYTTDHGNTVSVTLVLPKYADISRGYVSILTPIGVALLGLSPGQSIDWITNHGVRHTLTVNQVTQTPGSGYAPSSSS